MKDKEVNKIIGEFMGDERCLLDFSGVLFLVDPESQPTDPDYLQDAYTNSIDALVPVWEKIGVIPELDYNSKKDFQRCAYYFGREVVGNSFQQAAAHATAKAILELKDE